MQLDQAAPALDHKTAVGLPIKQQAAGNLHILQPIQNRPIGFIKMYAQRSVPVLTGVLNSNIAVALSEVGRLSGFWLVSNSSIPIMLNKQHMVLFNPGNSTTKNLSSPFWV